MGIALAKTLGNERETATSVRPNNAGDPASSVYLLERGSVPAALRCAACGRVSLLPHMGGERFKQSLQFMREVPERSNLNVEGRLFVGETVKLAYASRDLSRELEHSVIYIGERVMVAALSAGKSSATLAIFCESCGTNIASHVNNPDRFHYAWDRLIELAPQRLIQRWKQFRIGPWRKSAAEQLDEANEIARASALDDPRVRAYFFARDVIADGACPIRQMYVRALRAQVSLPEAKAALAALGASQMRNQAGEEVIIPGKAAALEQTPPPPWATQAAETASRARAVESQVTAGQADGVSGAQPSIAAAVPRRRPQKRPNMRELWLAFCNDMQLRLDYNISAQELAALAEVAMMGEFESTQDLLFMLRVMRGERG